MYHILLEEIAATLPNTPAQNKRIDSAAAECDGWKLTDASEDYKEPAVRVDTPSGGHYVVFCAGEYGCCTCPDFRERAVVKSEIACCKHVIGVFARGEWTVPAEAAPSSEEGEGPIDWRNAEPIGWEYVPGVGEVPCYAEEVVDAYGLQFA